MAVIRLIGIEGRDTSFDGEYLLVYDPERDGTDPETGEPMDAYLRTTPDRTLAKQFADKMEAFEYWRQTCQRQPLRPDGRPNRPLTAFTIEVT